MNELLTKLAGLSPERRALLERKLMERGMALPDRILPRADLSAPVPLSSAQKRLWFMQQLEPETVAYNMNLALSLSGPLDRAALERAFAALVARHEPLRTRFTQGADGQPQQIVEEAPALAIAYHDCRGAFDPDATARRHVAALVATPYELTRPPVRACLVAIRPDEHVLALGLHHIISDRWSMGLLARDLSAFYRAEVTGAAASLEGLPVQFADWALWEGTRLASPEAAHQLAEQALRLRGDLPVLELPLDRPRSPTAQFAGAHHPVRVEPALALALRALAAERNVSLFTLLLAAFNVFLHLLSDSDDIIVGSEVANRDRPETQAIMGPLVNTLVLRSDLSGDPTFSALLGRTAEAVRQALAQQDIPFERLVETVNPERSLSELNPLFQVKFDIQHSVTPPSELHGLTLAPYPLEEIATKYDLRFNLEDRQPDIAGRIEYSRELFDPETIAQMFAGFERVLDLIAEAPEQPLSRFSLIDAERERAIIAASAGPLRDFPEDARLHDLIRAQAEASPDAVAVTDGTVTWSYETLAAQSARIAAALMAEGVKPGDRVGLCMRRSPRMIAGLFGILEAGAAYVPLDADYPASRLAFIASDSGIDRVLSDHRPAFLSMEPATKLRLIDVNDLPDSPLPARAKTRPDDLAYIIYTSGSTGVPKGVAVEHRSVVAFLRWAQERFTREDVAFTFVPTSISFDLSVFELYAPLVLGGALVVAEHFLALASLADKVELTLVNTVPSLLQAYLQEHRLPDSLRVATFCGEPLPAALVDALKRDYPRLAIHNLYGPSEDTCFSTEVALHGDDYTGGVVPIGRPLPETRAYILDRCGRLRPPGLSGELYLAGAGLARGYFGRPAQTAERFLPDPFSGHPGARLYRTGDRVRRRRDGLLEFQGRLDHQIKLRGLRIETGEIEHHLERLPGVEKAVVTVTPGADRQLAAFIEPKDGATLREEDLRRALSADLPSHMVPTLWCLVAHLPQQPNGKIDRAALPALLPAAEQSAAPPETAMERRVAEAWSAVLPGEAERSLGDHFFRLGGHSLLAMRMIARLAIDLPTRDVLRTLFAFPRLKDFAAALEAAGGTARQARIVALEDGTRPPLSYAQQRLWALSELEPDSVAYNIPAALRLRGPLDREALARAFEGLSLRHAALRTRILTSDGRPEIVVSDRAELDIATIEAREDALPEHLSAESNRPFDLARGPLFRARIIVLGAEDHVVLVVIHHIVSDAQSIAILLREAMALYEAGPEGVARLPALPLGYGDFAAWQRRQDFAPSLESWRRQLEGAPPLLDLPTDFPRPARQDHRGDSVRFALAPDVTAALLQCARQADATPFMVMLSAFAGLLSRYCGSPDVVIGTPISQRPDPALDNVVGLFVNTLALRLVHAPTMSFLDQIAQVRAHVIEAFRHQDVPFECLVDALTVSRSGSHNPVFQAMLNWQSAETPTRLPAGLTGEALVLAQETAKVDLSLDVRQAGDGLSCNLIYRTDLFRRETIVHMAEALETLLRGLLAAPATPQGRIPFLPEAQRRQIARWNDTARVQDPEITRLHSFFERSACRLPEAIAVTDRARSLTYAALDHRAGQLAAALVARGIGPGSAVGICLARTVDLVAAMLAVLKTGAAYVPLDPNYPRERIAFVAADARLALLLTQDARADFRAYATLDLATVWEDAAGEHPAPARESAASCRDLAYLIYTSGSTGKPKGVAIEHRNAVAFVHWALETFPAESFAGMLASTSVCFDLSIFEIFATLAAGGRIFMIEDLFELADAAFADKITLINTVPTPMMELMRFGPLPRRARTVCLAGEPLPESLAEAILADGAVEALYNLYGPSEDTTYSTGCRVWPGEPIHIGRPIANTTAHVLDEAFHEVPIGAPGELYLAGAGIARGYHDRPDLTAERFLPNPFASSGDHPLLYRTGDRVRRRADGNLDYLGRADRQMKISGFRIEPGEVEAVLMRHAAVTGAAVDAWRDETGHARLAAWVETTGEVAISDLTAFLSERLPRHLVPTLIVRIDALPRLPNGKLDRKALPDPSRPDPSHADPSSKETAPGARKTPRPGTESRLAAIWEKLLGRSGIGREDNFFALGGDSILAIQVVAEARKQDLILSPRDLFLHATLSALAAATTIGKVEAESGPVTGAVALGPAQAWFFGQAFAEPDHWNQALLLKLRQPIDAGELRRALDHLHGAHDALRARFAHEDGAWQQSYGPVEAAPRLHHVRCGQADAAERLAETMHSLQRGFDLETGPVWGAALIEIEGGEQRLALAAHHLVIDGVSWRILLDDLATALQAGRDAGPRPALRRTTSFGQWIQRLAQTALFDSEFGYWSDIATAPADRLPRAADGGNRVADTALVVRTLGEKATVDLLHAAPSAYPIRPEELLIAALFSAVRAWTGARRLRLILESHGRSDLFPEVDLSRTLGWFTAFYPVLLQAETEADARALLLQVKESLRRIPHEGLGYGVLHHLKGRRLPVLEEIAEIRFNYLGQTDSLFSGDALFTRADESVGETRGAGNERGVLLDINAIVSGGRLRVSFAYSHALHDRETIEALAARFEEALAELTALCLTSPEPGYTPADFPHMAIDQAELEAILRQL
ncbi:non-ribosomal peptide synthetase [Rhizobium rhizosphaerae]|uniref:Non-ribosomal peptide synthetase n=1 Tax=Xaviernesmea rhizosphaerae TaxID=1672749 RepID=A0ABX3PGV6_9HYPH|nr:non-ribosomal peptide synthetase [Xaviernesmea rhizosphaerae]OQP87449.1 non-ribosomal peptide synthetase [Xaviernesmea rhizosphaerae]